MIKFFPDIKTFVQIGPLSIAWYAVFIITGAYIAYYLSLKNVRKMGFATEDIENLFIGALGFGILGARIWYVLFSDLQSYLANPIEIFMFRDGGLAIHGGLFAGIAFGYYFAKKHGLSFMQWSDAIVPNVLIAQALGRWGNFMNQEAFGNVVTEEYFRFFPTFIKNQMFIEGAYRIPTFLYESVLNLVGWFLIVKVLKKSKDLKRGDQSFAYLIWYGAIRFVIEGMRTDNLILNLGFVQLRIAQIISIIFVIVGLYGFYGGFKRFMTKNKPVLLFDFDGTVMDTQQVIFATYKDMFNRYKPEIDVTEEMLYSFLGPTLQESFGKYFDESEVDGLVEEYRSLNRELHAEYVKPMPHIVEVLENLKAQGYQIGIVSSKFKAQIMFALDITNMTDLFEIVYGIDDYEKSKPDPEGIIKAMVDQGYDRSQVIYFGDSNTDIEAGRRAGAFTIGYLYDEKRNQELVDSKPNLIIDDWSELPEILERNHEWTYNMI